MIAGFPVYLRKTHPVRAPYSRKSAFRRTAVRSVSYCRLQRVLKAAFSGALSAPVLATGALSGKSKKNSAGFCGNGAGGVFREGNPGSIKPRMRPGKGRARNGSSRTWQSGSPPGKPGPRIRVLRGWEVLEVDPEIRRPQINAILHEIRLFKSNVS